MCHDAGVDERAEAELQRLRARAYGPGADIHDDPLALRRLNELEEVHRAGSTRRSPPRGAPPPAHALGPPGRAQSRERGEPEEPIEPSVADPPSAEPPTANRRRRR